MILVLNFDKNPLYSSCEGIVNCVIDLYQEIIYEVGYSLSDLSDVNVEDKSQLILGLLGKENDVFEAINSQIMQIINTLVSENPTGTHEIVFPPRYIDWLRYNVNPAYRFIADALAKSNCKLEMSIDELYEQTISDNVVRKAKDTINRHPDIDCIVVSGVAVSEMSRFIKDITDNNRSIQVVDDSYKPLLGLLASKYLKLRDYEIVASLLKKIDTFDSWVGLVAHKMIEEADDIKDCIQQVKSKATNTREEKIISEIAKAWDIKSDNNLPSFGITLMQWLKYVSDENNPVNLPYYIAESRLGNIEEGIIWYKNSGDEGIIKAAYIHIGNIDNMIEQLNHEYSDSLYLDIRKICKTVNDMVYDFVHNSANHSVNPTDLCLIVSQKILGDVQGDIVAVKYKGIDEFINYLSEIYNEVNDWLNKTDTSINGAKAWVENLLYFGGEKDVVERLKQRIAEAKIEFERISDDYKAKREEEEKRRIIAEEMRKAAEDAKKKAAEEKKRNREEKTKQKAVEYANRKAEEEARINLIRKKIKGKYNMVFVPGGSFIMGQESKDPLAHEHIVNLSPFMVMNDVITNQFYATIMEDYLLDGELSASWRKLQDFLVHLNSITGEKFSIISEAQYEWILHNSTEFNLTRDEYCADDYGEYPYTEKTNPLIINGSSKYSAKVVRNGMARFSCDPDHWRYARLVRIPTQKEFDEYEEAERRRIEENNIKCQKIKYIEALIEAIKQHRILTEEEQKRKDEEKRQLDEQRAMDREKELKIHKKTVLHQYGYLSQNGSNVVDFIDEMSIAEQLMLHWKAVGKNGWSDEEKKKVDSVIGYYGLRGIVFNRNFSQGIGTDNWLSRENAKLTGYCCVFGIGRKVSYKAALDVIKQGKKAKLIESKLEREKIEELCNLRTPMSKDAEKIVQQKRFAYMLETSDKFMKGDKESDINQDPRFAFLILEKASDEGCEEATKRLSKCYREGIGTFKDEAKADELYKEEEIRKTETVGSNNTSSKVGFFGRLFGKKK